MNHKNKSLKKIGIVCLILGILILLLGIYLFITTEIGFTSWIILGSIVMNVIGITMLTHKTKYD